MAKGYWIGRVDIKDPKGYQKYIDGNSAAFEKFNARFLIRGGEFVIKEGNARERNVVIEFDSYELALACYESEEYQSVLKFRTENAICDVIVIQGFDRH